MLSYLLLMLQLCRRRRPKLDLNRPQPAVMVSDGTLFRNAGGRCLETLYSFADALPVGTAFCVADGFTPIGLAPLEDALEAAPELAPLAAAPPFDAAGLVVVFEAAAFGAAADLAADAPPAGLAAAVLPAGLACAVAGVLPAACAGCCLAAPLSVCEPATEVFGPLTCPTDLLGADVAPVACCTASPMLFGFDAAVPWNAAEFQDEMEGGQSCCILLWQACYPVTLCFRKASIAAGCRCAPCETGAQYRSVKSQQLVAKSGRARALGAARPAMMSLLLRVSRRVDVLHGRRALLNRHLLHVFQRR